MIYIFLPWIHWMAIVQNQYSLVVTFTFYVTKFWFSSQRGSRDFPRISSLKFFTIFSTVNSYYFFLYKNIVLVLAQFPKVTVSILLLLHTFCAYHVTRRYIVGCWKKMYIIQYKDAHDKYNTTQYVQVY